MVVWGALGVRAGQAGQTKPETGDYMSQYGTDYGASRSDGAGSAAAAASAAAASATATTAAAGTSTGHGNGRGAPVVSFENVSKHYGRLRAVDGLNLELRNGE